MAFTTPTLSIPHLAKGKVRDLFCLPNHPDTLLFVASDRISAYDVVLTNGIPNKGVLLTQLTAHWFSVLPSLVPGLKHHFLNLGAPADSGLSEDERKAIAPRSMTVRKLKVFPIEAIVRGYITGSVWKEYEKHGTVHGISVPAGIKQCGQLPGGALYTPSTKAPAGEHDVNIHPDEAIKIVGEKYAKRIEELSLAIYKAGAAYAKERGIIIADTKFEFGHDLETDEVVLIDEVLTSDSSRFWPLDTYEAGRDQDSFDKQILRNWLTEKELKGKEGVEMDEAIAKKTAERYRNAFTMLSGKTIEDVLKTDG
ncbi:Bifunctional purine biosynthetic protein ade1 [Zalerion maritima]|uniref:Phosphoribosylaminoimidazole-succinocarboxamide synthase n=1 Tax=Zalerion maritima TaxID=339359 RepID=A0AAD5RF47_9PEZI|nr:Bifunctional purine biosynthetic protein ade1 [Zalerion maritima]